MFWAPCSSGGGGVGVCGWGVDGSGWGWMEVGGGWLGGPPTHMHMHMHARTCMRGKHDNFMQMAAPIGFGEIPGIPYDVIHARTCVHVSVHMWGAPSHHPHPHPPTPHPPGGTSRISQNTIALELIEIFQFRLKI